MTKLLGLLVSYVGTSLWLVPLIAGAGWIAARLTRRLGVGLSHKIWVTALLGAVLGPVLPAVGLPLSAAVLHAGDLRLATTKFLTLQALSPGGVDHMVLLPHGVLRLLGGLYLCALLLLCLRLLRSLLGAVLAVRRASPYPLTPEIQQLWQESQQAFGVVGARLLVSPDAPGPVTLGARVALVLLPEGFAERVSTDDLRTAMLHELAHVRRRDFLKNFAYELATLPIAFHPVTWWIKAHVAQTREMVCDAMAVQRSGSSTAYIRSLLRLAAMVGVSSGAAPRATSFHAIGIFDANVLEERMMELRVGKPVTGGVLRCGLVALGALCLVSAMAAGAAAPLRIAAEDAAGTVGAEEVYQVGKEVKPPMLNFQADPEFPAASRNQEGAFNGSCEVALVVDRRGVPRDVHIVRSLRKDFDENALKAVRQYRFVPGTRFGKPVAVALLVDVNFGSRF